MDYTLGQIHNLPNPLSPDEQERLFARYQQGDKKAGQRLIATNLRLALKITKELTHSEPLAEMFQQAALGLAEALPRFDPTAGTKFTSYAQYWVRAKLMQYKQFDASITRCTSGRQERKIFYSLAKARNALGPDASWQEIADEIGVDDVDRVRRVAAILGAGEDSLDVPAYDEGVALVDTVIDEGANPERDALYRIESDRYQMILRDFEATLDDPRELAIWRKRMVTETPRTLSDLGDDWDVSNQRICQVEVNIRRRLESFFRDWEAPKKPEPPEPLLPRRGQHINVPDEAQPPPQGVESMKQITTKDIAERIDYSIATVYRRFSQADGDTIEIDGLRLMRRKEGGDNNYTYYELGEEEPVVQEPEPVEDPGLRYMWKDCMNEIESARRTVVEIQEQTLDNVFDEEMQEFLSEERMAALKTIREQTLELGKLTAKSFGNLYWLTPDEVARLEGGGGSDSTSKPTPLRGALDSGGEGVDVSTGGADSFDTTPAKSILFYGGEPSNQVADKVVRALKGYGDFDWVEMDDRKVQSATTRVKNGQYGMVVCRAKWSKHSHIDPLKEACKDSGTDYVIVENGTGPSSMLRAIQNDLVHGRDVAAAE